MKDVVIDLTEVNDIANVLYNNKVINEEELSKNNFNNSSTVNNLSNVAFINTYIHKIKNKTNIFDNNLNCIKDYLNKVVNNYSSIENNLSENSNSYLFDSESTLSKISSMNKISNFKRDILTSNGDLNYEVEYSFNNLYQDNETLVTNMNFEVKEDNLYNLDDVINKAEKFGNDSNNVYIENVYDSDYSWRKNE